MKQYFKSNKLKIFKFEIAIVLTGVFLMLLGGIFENNSQNTDKAQNLIAVNNGNIDGNEKIHDYSAIYEAQIEKLLSKLDGIGSISVAVYIKNEGTVSPAYNTKNDNSVIEENSKDGESAEENKNISEKNVVIVKDSQGNEDVFCISKTTPEIEGIAICVKGGIDNVNREKILKTLMALYNISSTKISIIGWANAY